MRNMESGITIHWSRESAENEAAPEADPTQAVAAQGIPKNGAGPLA